MASDGSIRRPWASAVFARVEPQLRLAGLAALTAAPVVLVITAVPQPFILPTLAFVAFTVAAVTWLTAWGLNTACPSNDVSLWDAAGALVLIGCAAAMFSEPDIFLKTVNQQPEQ